MLPPLAQHITVAPDRRAIKTDIGTRQACGYNTQSRRRQLALFTHFLQETVEFTGVVKHQLIGKAQLAQVIEQQALIRWLFVQLRMGGLAATGAQQANGCGAAVGGGRVEVVEYHVHLAEQRVVTQAHGIQVVPGHGTNIDHQQIERGRLDCRFLELDLARGFVEIELLQVAIERCIVRLAHAGSWPE